MGPTDLDSMYAAYREEFEDSRTVWIPNTGFANYKPEVITENSAEIYVQEVYVKPANRGVKFAAKLTNLCIEDASETFGVPITKVYTTVAIGGKTIDKSLRSITDYGFKVFKADHELIYFYKELKYE